MVLQADSVQVEAAEEESLQNPVVHTGELTPRKVLSWLPRNATPAQQDSMIRAHIKPSEIRWSTMPDTLHLPGHPAGKSFRDVSLPQYYRESFFSKDSLFHPELRGVEWVFRATRFHIRFRATTLSHRCCCYALFWHVLLLLSHVSLSSGSYESSFIRLALVLPRYRRPLLN